MTISRPDASACIERRASFISSLRFSQASAPTYSKVPASNPSVVRATPASASASGTSSSAIADNRVPPPKAVVVAASRSGRLTAAATSPPITRLAAITAPHPAEAARFDTRLSGCPLAQLEHRAQEDLGEGRERLNHVVHHLERHPRADRHRSQRVGLEQWHVREYAAVDQSTAADVDGGKMPGIAVLASKAARAGPRESTTTSARSMSVATTWSGMVACSRFEKPSRAFRIKLRRPRDSNR